MDVHACFNPKKVRRWSVFTRRGGVPSEVRDNLRGEVRARPSRFSVSVADGGAT